MDPPRWIETDNDIGFNESDFNKCENNFVVNYSTVQLLISVGMLSFGLFLCLAGYRAFRFTLWFSGFWFTFWCVLAICSRVENLPSGANWGAAFSVGTLAGFVTHLLPGVGTFLWGVYSGAIVTANILIGFVALGWYKASPIESASICLLLGGSFCGALILTRHWSRQGLIIATSISGAVLIVGGVDYFIEEWRLMAYLWHEVLKLAPEPQLKPTPCWYSYGIGATFYVFIGIGVFTQHMGTAKKYKKKVARVYVPPTVVSVYGTIRRTLGRNGEQRNQRARVVDYFPESANQSRAERSRDRARSRNQDRSNQPSARNSRRSSNRTRSQNQERNRLLDPPVAAPRNNRHQAVNVVDECPPAYEEIYGRVVRKPKSRRAAK